MFRISRITATMWVGLAASLGAGAAGFAGLYPQFDDGKLHVLLAFVAAFLAGPLAMWASRAPSWGHVLGRLLGVALILGIAATVPAAMILLDGNVFGVLYAVVTFGVVFGTVTGLLYGVPLAVLAVVARRHAADASHTGTDRAQRGAGIWLAAIGALVSGLAANVNRADGWVVPSFFALAVALAGVAIALHAQLRIRARASWIWRVKTGLEPTFRLRAPDPHDDLASLPRLAGGELVLERVSDPTSTTAYRKQAIGTAVALVDPASLL